MFIPYICDIKNLFSQNLILLNIHVMYLYCVKHWNKVAELEWSDILNDDPGNLALDRVKSSGVRQSKIVWR